MSVVLCPRLNELILERSPIGTWVARDFAPGTESDLWTAPREILPVWSGSSERTIFGDPIVNFAFRALHDRLHLRTGLSFSVSDEVELGRLQAAQFEGTIADLVFCEVAGQALEFQRTGTFIADQVEFTKQWLLGLRSTKL